MEKEKCRKSELKSKKEDTQRNPIPSTLNPSLSAQTSGQLARAARCACNKGRGCLRVCRWPVRYGRSESLQPRMLGEWWAERLDCMWPGSDLLIMKAGGGENKRNEGTRRSGVWERRRVALGLKAGQLGSRHVVGNDRFPTACVRFTPCNEFKSKSHEICTKRRERNNMRNALRSPINWHPLESVFADT